MKKTAKRFAALLLSFLMMIPAVNFAAAAEELPQDTAPVEESAVADELDLFREDFYDLDSTAENTAVVEGKDNIKHVPQEYVPFSTESSGQQKRARAASVASSGPFKVGSVKTFSLDDVKSYGTYNIKGKVLAQGKYTNLWILDDTDFHAKTKTSHSTSCTLKSVTSSMQTRAIQKFDAIYARMTSSTTGFGKHYKYLAKTLYGNMPYVGDLGNDGKVNVLLYDIDGDGAYTSGSSYTAGFYNKVDMFSYLDEEKTIPGNAIDLFHMDIGKNQCFDSLVSTSETGSADFYGTFAHEFQHMLFDIHFGIYANTQAKFREMTWLTEALSALAEQYYTIPGKQYIGFDRMIFSTVNGYKADYSSRYGDFLNFNNSMKNYGMGAAHASMMYQRTNKLYARKLYAYLTSGKLSSSSFTTKYNYVSKTSFDDIFGGAFKSALGSSFSKYSNVSAFQNMYYLFMENYAADGGRVVSYASSSSSPTYKMSFGTGVLNNLWAIRPALGSSLNVGGGQALNLSGLPKIPTVKNGSRITLSGTGTTYKPSGATHEMFYRLGSNKTSPYLNINIPEISGMKYYIAIPDSSTSKGATLHKMNSGVSNRINTGGKTAYLYVVTYKKNISTTVSMSWSSSLKYNLTIYSATGGKAKANTTTFTAGKKITMTAYPSAGYRFKSWSIKGATLSGNSFTMPKSDVKIRPIFEKLPYTLSSVSVTTKPKTLTYTAGQKFNKSGMVVTAKFTNGSKKNVSSYVSIAPSTALKTSNTYVRISYTYGGVTKSTTLPIKVTAAPAVQTAKITATSHDGIRISWNAIPGASGYEVYRAYSANGAYTRIYTATKGSILTYANRGLTTGKAYYYKVRAYKVSGSKKTYGISSKAVGARPTLSAPSLSVTALKESAKISWGKVSGASGYILERKSPTSGNYVAIRTMNSSTFSYTNLVLLTGKTYYYRVRAYKFVGGTGAKAYSGYSAVKAAKAK